MFPRLSCEVLTPVLMRCSPNGRQGRHFVIDWRPVINAHFGQAYAQEIGALISTIPSCGVSSHVGILLPPPLYLHSPSSSNAGHSPPLERQRQPPPPPCVQYIYKTGSLLPAIFTFQNPVPKVNLKHVALDPLTKSSFGLERLHPFCGW